MLELDKWYVVQLEYNTIILSSYAIQSCACAKLCSGSGQSSFELIANQGITHLLICCHHFQLKSFKWILTNKIQTANHDLRVDVGFFFTPPRDVRSYRPSKKTHTKTSRLNMW